MEKYDNLGMVGEGSYGMVMKCKHKESGQIVAIKKFLESEDDKMVKKIAMREVRMLRKLRHENLVNLIEVFRRRKRLYLVFEFVDHTVLDDLEKYPNGLNEMSVRKILWQVLRGVEFCHSHNIIHRDIKPENILNSRSGVIKLCDFGFARTLAAPGEVYTDYVATRWYRAPELLVGDTKYGRAVDVWAVGCLITEMLTGDPLFPGDSDIDQLYHIIKCFGNLCPRHREIFQRNPLFAGMRLPDVRDVEPLERKFPKFSSEVLDLMKQCLRLDPNDRPSSSLLLRHEFFRKDGFEEKVIPELRVRIQKDSANNLLARKEEKQKREQEKKKKMKEQAMNNSQEAKDSQNVSASKKSPDRKNIARESPTKHDTPSPKKDNMPAKSNVKTPTTTPPADEKKRQRDSDKERKQAANLPKQLPAVESKRDISPGNVTPRPKFSENSPTEKNKGNMPSILKKRVTEDNLSESVTVSQNSSTKSTPNGILKSHPNKKSSTKLDIAEKPTKSSETVSKHVKISKETLTKTSSDTQVQQRHEKHVHVAEKSHSTEKSYKQAVSVEQKQSRREGSKVDKSTRQGQIPPIQTPQNQSKTPTPDTMMIVNSSMTSSPLSTSDKQIPTANFAGPTAFKGSEKVKKSSQASQKKNESTAQGSFDRSMYPDKTSHFEKMMMSMSGTTSITHPAIKKNNQASTGGPGQPAAPGSFGANPGGTSGMQYHYRHMREDKSSGLPLWSHSNNDEKFLQSSLESAAKSDGKYTKHSDEKKLREKSPKPGRKDGKAHHGHEDKSKNRESKNESRPTRLPDLGHKISISLQDRDHFPDLKSQDARNHKTKKSKTKSMLMSIPALDSNLNRSHLRSRSPSPTGNLHTDSNFPSLHSKN
ncbi:uncharacterized protein LOC143470019 isoform X1 [Clavelina lepadiformis]|uniref:uncharacterized protein LOC143470019 isoform X1 n=1 Tax=Clavelina lepadiformis TaxID=159417 RepID=UPI0040423F68